MRPLRIAIDGAAASGKTTVARMLADRLGLMFLDTGAMYRALTWQAQRRDLHLDDSEALARMAQDIRLEVLPDPARPNGCRVLVDGLDVSDELSSQAVSRCVPRVASVSGVRREMVRLQREQAARQGVVMAGRDIGSVVLPDAEVKVFLVADLEERARRRWNELQQNKVSATLNEVREELAQRDRQDTEREDSPLVCTPDAHRLDSTGLAPGTVVDRILELVEKKFGTVR